jgi:biotin carboxyl carrier protein
VTDETSGRPAAGDDEPRGGLQAVTDDILPPLIARLRASRLGEIEVRTAEWRVRLRRDPAATNRSSSGLAGRSPGTPEEVGSSVARSTAVGYFSPSATLAIGHLVQAGDLLGTVDVLGIAHEVNAPEDGVISRILAEDGQAVEYGQALADIDPLGIDFGAEPAEDEAL